MLLYFLPNALSPGSIVIIVIAIICTSTLYLATLHEKQKQVYRYQIANTNSHMSYQSLGSTSL